MTTTPAPQLSLMELFKLGSHRGNRRSKLNPKLKSYVYGNKDGLSLIDLAKMQNSLSDIESFLYKLGNTRKQILIVGTETHLQEITKDVAAQMGPKGQPFISSRWLGGTLTNWATVKKTLKNLEKNEKILENEKFFKELARNEQLSLVRETEKLRAIFGGLVDLKSNRPGAVVILDAATNYVAIKEAEKINVPVIAILNTSALILPKDLKYSLVCNNNSVNLVKMLSQRLVDAYNSGSNDVSVEEVKQVVSAKVDK